MHKDGEHILNLINTGIQFPLGGENFCSIDMFDCLSFSHLGPDLIGFSHKTIYGIEHFKVDSSRSKKGKGSSLKYEEILKKKKIEEKINADLNKTNVSSESFKIDTNLSYDNLKNNIILNFENHYKKITEYRKNINLKYGNQFETKIVFLIEYDKVLPSIPIKNGVTGNYIFPHLDIELLNFFIDKKDLFGIIFNYQSKNIFIPVLEKYLVDNKNIFDFSEYIIKDLSMNIAITGLRCDI